MPPACARSARPFPSDTRPAILRQSSSTLEHRPQLPHDRVGLQPELVGVKPVEPDHEVGVAGPDVAVDLADAAAFALLLDLLRDFLGEVAKLLLIGAEEFDL